MKRYMLLFLTFIIAVLLCACAQNGAANITAASHAPTSSNSTTAATSRQTESVQSQTKDSKNQEVTIQISPPEGWTPIEGSVLPVHYMKNTASVMVKAEPFTSGTLDEVVNEALEIYRKTFDNVITAGNVETITVDSKEAKKLMFTCTVSKLEMKYLYVYLFAEGKTYVITFGDSASTFDSLSSDFETILSNIKFKA